jgi:hypothetical protein
MLRVCGIVVFPCRRINSHVVDNLKFDRNLAQGRQLQQRRGLEGDHGKIVRGDYVLLVADVGSGNEGVTEV